MAKKIYQQVEKGLRLYGSKKKALLFREKISKKKGINARMYETLGKKFAVGY